MAGRHGHRCHIDGLVIPTPGRVAFGPAATIRFLPRRLDLQDGERHDFARLFLAAVGPRGGGKVLVVSSGGYPDESLGGGKKLSRLHNHGLSGLVCDGRLRDFAGLAVIPAADAREVLEEAVRIEERDAAAIARIRAEDARPAGG